MLRPTAPAPKFEHAPSPIAGTHLALASAGQRRRKAGRIPMSGWSSIGESVCSSTCRCESSGRSQRRARWSYKPVAEAIPCAARLAPEIRWYRYSPSDIHHFVRAYAWASCSRSQRSFAGRYEAWRTQPVRACVAPGSSSRRSAAAAARARVSAHVSTRVVSRPRSSTPRRLCQNVETATASISPARRPAHARTASIAA